MYSPSSASRGAKAMLCIRKSSRPNSDVSRLKVSSTSSCFVTSHDKRGESRPRFVQGLRRGPGNRAFVGDPENDSLFVFQHSYSLTVIETKRGKYQVSNGKRASRVDARSADILSAIALCAHAKRTGLNNIRASRSGGQGCPRSIPSLMLEMPHTRKD